MGREVAQTAINDAARLACVEVFPDERSRATTGFPVRALRLPSLRRIRTRPSAPKTNGKAERLVQTLPREWRLRHSLRFIRQSRPRDDRVSCRIID